MLRIIGGIVIVLVIVGIIVYYKWFMRKNG